MFFAGEIERCRSSAGKAVLVFLRPLYQVNQFLVGVDAEFGVDVGHVSLHGVVAH